MSLDDYRLVPDPLDSHAYYDWVGNRYVFTCHEEYEVARRIHLIDWLTGHCVLLFM
jgi:hypothetical protein